MNMRNIITAGIMTAGLAFASSALAEEPEGYLMDDQASCTTSSASWNGSRKSCNITVCVAAGFGEEIHEYYAREIDHRGTGSGCGDAYVAETQRDSRTGKTFVTKVCAHGNARSYSRSHGGRGRVECEIVGYSRVPSR